MRTREFALGPVLDEEEMIFEDTEGVITTYKVEFYPNAASVVWEVEITSPLGWEEDNPHDDEDDVEFGVVNNLVPNFHHDIG